MSKPIFEPNEAEHLVRQLREHLRESIRIEQEHGAVAAQFTLWRAYDIRDDLLLRLQRRFWDAAKTELKTGYSTDAIEDAVLLMTEAVAVDLMTLTETGTALAYEREESFNGIVKLRILGALRIIRRQEKFMYFGVPLSLDEPLGEDAEGETLGSEVKDHRACHELEKIFDGEIAARFKKSLTPEQLQMVELRLRYPDDTAATLARAANIPERTARYRLDGAMKLLVDIIRGEK